MKYIISVTFEQAGFQKPRLKKTEIFERENTHSNKVIILLFEMILGYYFNWRNKTKLPQRTCILFCFDASGGAVQIVGNCLR